MTVGFGHGISVSPLHVVRGTAAVANAASLVRPTLLALQPSEVPEGRAAGATLDRGDHAQADAAGGDRRLRQERRGGGLLPRRQDRHRGEGRQARLRAGLQGELQRLRLHQRVPDECASLRGLHDAGRAARQQKHLRLLHRRLGGGAGGRAGDRAHGADDGAAAGHPGRAGDQPGAVDPAGAGPSAGRAGAWPWHGGAGSAGAVAPGAEAGADGAGPGSCRRRRARRAAARGCCCARAGLCRCSRCKRARGSVVEQALAVR